MWPGRGYSGGAWPPAFPHSLEVQLAELIGTGGFRYLFCKFEILRAIQDNRNGRDSQILKTRFLIFLYYIQKEWIRQELKLSTLDIRIKQSGLKVSHSEVPSSGNTKKIFKIYQ